MKMTGPLPPSKCFECGYEMDHATVLNDDKAVPRAGSFSLCINCGFVMRFNAGLLLDPAKPSDIYKELDPERRRLLITARSLIKKRGPFAKPKKK